MLIPHTESLVTLFTQKTPNKNQQSNVLVSCAADDASEKMNEVSLFIMLYVPILAVGVILCVVGDGQRLNVSLTMLRLGQGFCVVCPHTYYWCHTVYCGKYAEVQYSLFHF